MEDEEGNQVRRRKDSSGGSRAEAKEETALDALEKRCSRSGADPRERRVGEKERKTNVQRYAPQYGLT